MKITDLVKARVFIENRMHDPVMRGNITNEKYYQICITLINKEIEKMIIQDEENKESIQLLYGIWFAKGEIMNNNEIEDTTREIAERQFNAFNLAITVLQDYRKRQLEE